MGNATRAAASLRGDQHHRRRRRWRPVSLMPQSSKDTGDKQTKFSKSVSAENGEGPHGFSRQLCDSFLAGQM